MRANGASLLRNVFRPLAGFVCLCTALPLWRSRAWWVRGWDFPRLQLSLLGLAALGSGYAVRHRLSRAEQALLAATGAAVLAQGGQMIRYTPLSPREVVQKPPNRSRSLRLLTANVRMRNRQAPKLLEVVRSTKPDVVLLMETNEWWMRQVEPLCADYPHVVQQPQDNTYGMVLLSKLRLEEPRTRFLVEKGIPSITTRLRLRDGQQVWLYCLHPRPPARMSADGEVELPGSALRDAELVIAGMEIEKLREPVIVAGDFNDVAWSHTTRRFQRISRMLDPRVGRGLYPTWHAGNRLLRFPLDHLFVSEHFALADFRREQDIGSDHFPLYAELVISASAEALQEPPKADAEDFEEAEEDLAAAASKTEEPSANILAR